MGDTTSLSIKSCYAVILLYRLGRHLSIDFRAHSSNS